MKIIIIHKDKFAHRPPVISVLFNLLDLENEVVLIDNEINEFWKEKLDTRGVSYYEIPNKGGSLVRKVLEYLSFRINVYKIVEREKSGNNDVILWVEGAQTIFSLGKKLNKYRHILQIQELHEKVPRQLKAISKVINTSYAVFMPEYNRTVLYKFWFNLNKMPVVLPNKPYYIPTSEELEKIGENYGKYLDILKEKKVILYQGGISQDRDLSGYIKAVKKLGNEFLFIMVGKDFGMVEKYKKLDPNVIHINYLPAPDYFIFTSKAYIGVVSYDFSSLNNAYCAPNKIWEYSHFGLPMIGNDVPGLKYTIFQAGAGISVDEKSPDSIMKAISIIDNNYSEYKSRALKFYNSVDNKKIIKKVLENFIK